MDAILIRPKTFRSPFLSRKGPTLLFRPKSKSNQGKPRTDPTEKISPAHHGLVLCRQCLHVITSPEQQKIINGSHVHTFANPDGIVFEIVCYRDAWGCGYIGPASPEFTWFSGYVWRIAVCANCHIHMGWRFSNANDHYFHGLITSRLIVKET